MLKLAHTASDLIVLLLNTERRVIGRAKSTTEHPPRHHFVGFPRSLSGMPGKGIVDISCVPAEIFDVKYLQGLR